MTPEPAYLTSDAVRAEQVGRRRSKYGVAPKDKRTWCGVTYASKLEMRRLIELHDRVARGNLLAVIEQPRFRLGTPEAVYVADALVVPCNGCPWVEDIKGRETPKFKKDVELWKRWGPLTLYIVTWSKGEWHYEIVHGGRRTWRTSEWHVADLAAKARESDG